MIPFAFYYDYEVNSSIMEMCVYSYLCSHIWDPEIKKSMFDGNIDLSGTVWTRGCFDTVEEQHGFFLKY